MLEKFPEVEALSVDEKLILMDELNEAVSRQSSEEPADPALLELLQKRFDDYYADPSSAVPIAEVWEKLKGGQAKWKS